MQTVNPQPAVAPRELVHELIGDQLRRQTPDWRLSVLLPALRRTVLATSRPPLSWLYRGWYRALIDIVVRRARKHDFVKAVYLRRGCAKGEVIPGISDIDFALIVTDAASDEVARFNSVYQRLARRTLLLDPSLEIYDARTLAEEYRTSTYHQYRFTEGKRTWKLLYGRDYLAELPSVARGDLMRGFYTEVTVWWSLFAARIFQQTARNPDRAMRHSICYKATGELLRMELGLLHDKFTLTRPEALSLAASHLDTTESETVARLERAAAARYLRDDDSIVEVTKDLLIRRLDRLHHSLYETAVREPFKQVTQRVDCSRAELLCPPSAANYAQQLAAELRGSWGTRLRGVRLLPSVFFNVEELLLLIELDPEHLPEVAEVQRLVRRHWQAQLSITPRINLFLFLPHVALQIDLHDHTKSLQAVLSATDHPDVFQLALDPAFCVGESCEQRSAVTPLWTAHTNHFFEAELRLCADLLADPVIYKLKTLDFLRLFWKTAQFVLVQRGANRGEVMFPLTLPAIERGLAREGIELPARLRILREAYTRELSGAACDIGERVHEAIQYLKEIMR